MGKGLAISPLLQPPQIPQLKGYSLLQKFFHANSQLGSEVLPYKEPEGLTTSSSSILLERHYLTAQAPKERKHLRRVGLSREQPSQSWHNEAAFLV